MSNSIKIYVASLADYNNGRLHGVWIEAHQSADAIQTEVNAMLKASNEPNAEEWAIHDYEGFGSIKLSEHTSFEIVSILAELLTEHGEAFAAWHCSCDGHLLNAEELAEKFQEAFAGEYESLADFAESESIEQGLEIPEHLLNYIDWEAMAKDWVYGGDICVVENGHKSIFVFRNNFIQ